MAINELLDELEELVVGSNRVPFTNKCVIEEDNLMRLVEGLRKELPQTIKSAEDVIRNKQQILDEAKKDADNMLDQAKEYATKITAEDQIMEQARTQAKEIMDKTIENSTQLRTDSLKYANDVFEYALGNLNSALQAVQEAQTGLNENVQAAPTITPVKENQK